MPEKYDYLIRGRLTVTQGKFIVGDTVAVCLSGELSCEEVI